MPKISLYERANHVRDGDAIPIDIFLEYIRDGKWQDIVLPIRAIEDKKARDARKKQVPAVTLSGLFRERKDSDIVEHSGYIGMDIDDVDPEAVKDKLHGDSFIYAMFSSISGRGLCIVFKINGDKHREAFGGLSEYLFRKYQLICDPTSVNPSRARFISFDPHLYLNTQAAKFTHYAKKEKEKPPAPVIFVQTDFDLIIKQIQEKHIDITVTYNDWLRVGFAISDKFGEAGRNYFHIISSVSAKYDQQLCDKQYTACLKSRGSGVTIATMYYLCKNAGIVTQSDKTQTISRTAYNARKGHRTQEDTIKLLSEAEGIPAEESAPIVEQVFNGIAPPESDNEIEELEQWLRQNFTFRRNVITQKVEINDVPVDDIVINSLFIACKKIFSKVTYELLDRLINSNFTPNYNPIHEWFERHLDIKPTGVIEAFFETIKTDTGMRKDEFFPHYAVYFGRKWLVGAISSIFGKHSPLMYVLSGEEQNTGKTEWFRRMLPPELENYYAESKLDSGDDAEILMSEKWFLMDDEMGGKSKQEEKKLKSMTSKQKITLRKPYGRYNVDLQRIAVLCGTSNDKEIIFDPTGNRRLIPVNVLSIDFEKYNAINKTELLMEAYWLWKNGFKWELTKDDIRILGENNDPFVQSIAEIELITKYFELPEKQEPGGEAQFYTTTEIKAHLEQSTGQKLNINKIGQALRKIGWLKKKVRRNTFPVDGYWVIKRNGL